ncbi:hypothetical protein FVE85_3567 [Porphyridium purpureum]|uniref:Uncharacterized protein n=1 Tax=Porphyridium purpureum TaxID=35688 RepID=A0A5J4YKX6_PORPP|nr:hypothetical protein FVE85_3567 [Porphyridium purpureum]|eukprot:POR2404..scf249_10
MVVFAVSTRSIAQRRIQGVFHLRKFSPGELPVAHAHLGHLDYRGPVVSVMNHISRLVLLGDTPVTSTNVKVTVKMDRPVDKSLA